MIGVQGKRMLSVVVHAPQSSDRQCIYYKLAYQLANSSCRRSEIIDGSDAHHEKASRVASLYRYEYSPAATRTMSCFNEKHKASTRRKGRERERESVETATNQNRELAHAERI